jgi:hypothetical protein
MTGLNPAGDHNEIWQHSGGCRSHLKPSSATRSPMKSRRAFCPRTWRAAPRPPHIRSLGMSPRRTPSAGRIDRLRTIRFTFDGTAYDRPPGRHAGLGAACQCGVSLFGRSFKYHRPRGVLDIRRR